MTDSHIPTSDAHLTFGEARDRYLQHDSLKSQHTIDAYRRAIELFFDFLRDRSGLEILPIQRQLFVTPEQIPLSTLSPEDIPLFHHFARWMLAPGSGKTGDKRPYKASTVELRLAGIHNWFQFMKGQGWLPDQFALTTAKRFVREDQRLHPVHSTPTQPPDDIEHVIYYYDTQEMPGTLRKPDIDPERLHRWESVRLRNAALLHILAETGGRISEILSLNLTDFLAPDVNKLHIEVLGKGGHTYSLHFEDALPAVRAYIHARGTHINDVPLFLSHDPRYDGQRMSRVVAWRVVQRAARALGLRDITPHDFRHWRAVQLLRAGYTVDEVQDYLGHQSVETTRAFYVSPPAEPE